jgi:hypothetical protein
LYCPCMWSGLCAGGEGGGGMYVEFDGQASNVTVSFANVTATNNAAGVCMYVALLT